MIIKNGKRIDGCSDTVPIGTLNPFLGSTAPYGYLICQGQKVSKTTYKELYEICGDTFGQSTATEFYLPDLRGQIIAGYKEGDSTFGTLGGLIGSLTHLHSTGNHTLTAAESGLRDHQHGGLFLDGTEVGIGNGSSSGYSQGISSGNRGTRYITGQSTSAPASQPHNHGDTSSNSSLQPTIVLNWIVKAFQLMPNQSYVSSVAQNSDVNTYSCNYINDRTVKVSPEEPTTGENVWIEFANYFSPQEIVNCYVSATVGSPIEIISSDTSKTYKKVCNIESGKTYRIKWKANNPEAFGVRASAICDSNDNVLQAILHDNTNSSLLIFTATSSGYLYLGLDKNATEITITDKIPNIKVNNNGSYETIVYSNTYSTEEQVIGTWFGKILYRKCITHDIVSTNQEREPHNIANLDYLVDNRISLINQYGHRMVFENSKLMETSADDTTFYLTSAWPLGLAYITLEYTKTTD